MEITQLSEQELKIIVILLSKLSYSLQDAMLVNPLVEKLKKHIKTPLEVVPKDAKVEQPKSDTIKN